MKRLFLTSKFSAVTKKFAHVMPELKGLKVAFVPTASDLYENTPWIDADRDALMELGLEVEDYYMEGKDEDRIYSELKEKDGIFVAGGNTFYLLQKALESGFAPAVTRLVEEGKLYIGSSAGSVLVGPMIGPVETLDDPEEAPDLYSYIGLGLVDFVTLPHAEPEKLDEYQSIVDNWGDQVTLQLLRDDEAIFVEDENILVF